MKTSRPNVLFLTADDMNDWVGCLGGYAGKVHTPNIDRLAARGRLFANAHCPAPLCNPSRTAVMTGLRPSTTGIYDNSQWWRPALPDVTTLPEHFRANGYFTAGCGKVYHHTPGFNPPEQWDTYSAQVFDFGIHLEGDPSAPVDPTTIRWREGFPRNGIENVRLGVAPPAQPVEFDWGLFDRPEPELGDGRMACWTADFLSRPQHEPFFLAAGSFRPHLPWYAPGRFFDLYPLRDIVTPEDDSHVLDQLPTIGRQLAEDRQDEWQMLRRLGKHAEAVRAYLASISYTDSLVGRILDALDDGPHATNTIVVLWVDHGFHLGEKGHWHKSTLWERATHVPMIVADPRCPLPGNVCERAVNTIDLYPTLVDLCGLSQTDRLDGVSLTPLLNNPDAVWGRPSVTTYGKGNHAIRSERYRYIRYCDGGEELYDHHTDRHERVNLAARPAFESIRQSLARWLPATDAEPARSKQDYVFNADTYEWRLQEMVASEGNSRS